MEPKQPGENQGNINQQPEYRPPVQNQGEIAGVVVVHPNFMSTNQPHLRSHSQLLSCNNCNKLVQSNITANCNILNYLMCCWFGTGVWMLFNSLRQKDLNCYDANHYCPLCNAQLGLYTAC